jgi:hypothetical protein
LKLILAIYLERVVLISLHSGELKFQMPSLVVLLLIEGVLLLQLIQIVVMQDVRLAFDSSTCQVMMVSSHEPPLLGWHRRRDKVSWLSAYL